MPTYDAEKTLSENLTAFGFFHTPQKTPRFHDVVDASGVVVFEGKEDDVRRWLRETGGCLGDGNTPHLDCCPYAAF